MIAEPKIEVIEFYIHGKDGDAKPKFHGNKGSFPNSFNKERKKIYIVIAEDIETKKGECFYIGETETAINIRFQRAFKSYRYYKKDDTHNGYKGYKWIEAVEGKKLMVCVATFDFESTHELLEAVEGELVLLVRNETDKWPLYQNEIHFWNEEGAIDYAKFIFNKTKHYFPK